MLITAIKMIKNPNKAHNLSKSEKLWFKKSRPNCILIGPITVGLADIFFRLDNFVKHFFYLPKIVQADIDVVISDLATSH